MLDQIIAWAALLFSGIALIVALRVQRRQPELIAKQIAEIDRGSRDRHAAQVVATLESKDSWTGYGTTHSIRMTNNGPAEAAEIMLRFLDSNSPVPQDESQRKLPIRVLHAGGSVELIAAISHDHAPPFNVALAWRDGLGSQSYETTLA